MDASSVLASVTLGATSNSTVVSLSNSVQSPTQPSPSATPSPHHRSGSVSPQVTVSSPLPNGIVPSPSEKGSSSNHRHSVQGSVQRVHKASSQAINVHSNSKARHSSSLSSSSANTAAKLQHQGSGSAAGDGGRRSSSSSPKLSSTTASTSVSSAALTTTATASTGKGGHQHHHQTLAHMHIKSAAGSSAGSSAASVGGSNAITKTIGGRLNVPSLQVTFPLPRQVVATGSQPQTVFAMRPTDDRQRQDLTSTVQPQGHGGSSSGMIS